MEPLLQPVPALAPMQAAKKPRDWNDLVKETKIEDIAKQRNRKVILLHEDVPLKTALNILHDNNVLSAPVTNNDHHFEGFIDVLDISGYALQYYHSQMPQFRVWETNSKLKFPAAEQFFETPIRNITNYSLWNYPVYVYDNNSIADLLVAFHERHFKAHRVAVLNRNNEFVNIVSQTDVAHFAYKNTHLLGEKASMTISDLRLVKPCISVRMDTPFANALEVLFSNRVSGIALLDHEGKIAGNFSASDLRGLLPSTFDDFYCAIPKFLEDIRATRKAIPPVTCTNKATLAEVLELFCTQSVHRIYVVDEHYKPYGVVSLSEVMWILQPS